MGSKSGDLDHQTRELGSQSGDLDPKTRVSGSKSADYDLKHVFGALNLQISRSKHVNCGQNLEIEASNTCIEIQSADFGHPPRDPVHNLEFEVETHDGASDSAKARRRFRRITRDYRIPMLVRCGNALFDAIAPFPEKKPTER